MFYLILCVFLEIMDDLTKRIVELAYTKFLQFGIRRISIDDICNELRISKKTFYRIFPKKEDLVEEALKYRNELAIEKFKKMIRNKNAIDSLVATMKFIKDHINEECSSFFYDISKYYPSIAEIIHKFNQFTYYILIFEDVIICIPNKYKDNIVSDIQQKNTVKENFQEKHKALRYIKRKIKRYFK